MLGKVAIAVSVSRALASRTLRNSLSNFAALAKDLRAAADSFLSREKRSSTLFGIIKHEQPQRWLLRDIVFSESFIMSFVVMIFVFIKWAIMSPPRLGLFHHAVGGWRNREGLSESDISYPNRTF